MGEGGLLLQIWRVYLEVGIIPIKQILVESALISQSIKSTPSLLGLYLPPASLLSNACFHVGGSYATGVNGLAQLTESNSQE